MRMTDKFLTDFWQWHHACPYGLWTCGDGRQVLFNRSYWPVLERHGSGDAKAAWPGEWVAYKSMEHFFDDWTAPWRKNREAAATLSVINAVLEQWRLPKLGPPPKRKEEPFKVLTASEFVAKVPPPRINPWTAILHQEEANAES
jgi:hypothetical protein